MVGAKANYSQIDVLLTFLYLKNQKSRSALVKEIGVGEGTIRSMLEILKTKGLILSSPQGTVLSKKGEEMYQHITKSLEPPIRICSRFFQDCEQASLVLHTPKKEISWQSRDIAIANGAKAALILVQKDHLVAREFEEDFSEIERQVKSKRGDIVISTAAVDQPTAQKAALAIAMQSTPALKEFL